MITSAKIKLWGKILGAVSWDDSQGYAVFEYEKNFVKQGWNVAPVKMPIDSPQKIYAFPELSDSSFKGMPGLLADVMPDKYGNILIDAWLARNGRKAGSLNPVEILCYIGKRGMGALEFEPVNPKGNTSSTKIDLDGLIKIASDILAQREKFKSDLSKDKEKCLTDILKIGTSAGGARAKAIITYNPVTGEVKSGQADADEGFTHWLIKFDGVTDKQLGTSYGYGRIEMAYHNMAVACGIQMQECKLLEENGRAHFMTRRFDRPEKKEKLHVQSFHAMQHYDFNDVNSFSYEQLFQTIRSLKLSYTDEEQLFRRMIFNVIARNCDDHTKNFSFIMDKEGTWRFSPAYDVCYSYRPNSLWVSRQSLSVNGKKEGITKNDFLEVADKMGIKSPEPIIKDINKVVKNWMHYAKATRVENKKSKEIQNNLNLV